MATRGALSTMQDQAIKRLVTAMQVASEKLNVDPVEIPRDGRDPAVLQAKQLAAAATWIEDVARSLGFDDRALKRYDLLEDEALRDLVESEGIAMRGLVSRGDMLEALRAQTNSVRHEGFDRMTDPQIEGVLNARGVDRESLVTRARCLDVLTALDNGVAVEVEDPPPAEVQPKESVAPVAVEPEPEPAATVDDTQYDGLTVSQLRELATDRGVDLSGMNSKAKIIEALMMDDEAEQV